MSATDVERVGTAVVGGGAAGLAAAWHLRQRGQDFMVLDERDRTGDSWRTRYQSLRLFTPARFSALPGMPMPLPAKAHPDKDQYANYLEHYAAKFKIPVVRSSPVVAHRWRSGRHLLDMAHGRVEASRLVVATGAWRAPALPAFASRLDPAVHQVHSSQYRHAGALRPGPVLVVGAGPAGADIASDAAREHLTWLSGPAVGHVPVSIVRSRLVRRWAYGLKVPDGRWGTAAQGWLRRRRSPLIWQTERDLRAAGIIRVPRTIGVRAGRPVLEDGRSPDVANVVWCTGFRPDFRWLQPSAVGSDGWPLHRRGLSSTIPGLAFVGLPFQHTLGSGFLAGMSTDAEHVIDGLTSRQ